MDNICQFLKHLDPALFQNVIIGILAIYIPLLIISLSYNNKEKKHFHKLVLLYEVFNAKIVFIVTVSFILIFALIPNNNLVSVFLKIISLILIIIYIGFSIKLFNKIVEFLQGHKNKYEISFLKKLSSKNRVSNKYNVDNNEIEKIWRSILEDKDETQDENFTNIFLDYIDTIIENNEIGHAVILIKIYLENINNRGRYIITDKFLLRFLEWDRKFWMQNQNDISSKNKYWIYRSNQNEFFNLIFKYYKYNSIDDQNKIVHFFLELEKYIDNCQTKLKKEKKGTNKKNKLDYLVEFLQNFTPMFFQYILNSINYFELYNSYFPPKWKIASENMENELISKYLLIEFLKWSEKRITSSRYNENKIDESLDLILELLFPEIVSITLSDFLILLFANNLKSVIDGLADDVSVEVDQKKSYNEIIKIFREDTLRKGLLKRYVRQQPYQHIFNIIRDILRKDTLKKYVNKLEDEEIITFCINNADREQRRLHFIELIKGLLGAMESKYSLKEKNAE